MESLGTVSRLLSVAGAELFTGAAMYCALVEVPARKAMGSPLAMLANWQETFPRAKYIQSKIALFSTASGLFGWYTDTDPQKWLLGVSTLLIFSVLPFTILFIQPTNRSLLDGEGAKKKGEKWIEETVKNWGNLHSVRILLSGSSVLVAGVYWFNKIHPFL